MDSINLLPQKQRLEILSEQRFRLAIFILIWLSLAVLVSDLLFYSASKYLSIQETSLGEQLSYYEQNSSWKEILDTEKKIKNFNAYTSNILDLQSKNKLWSPLVAELTKNITDGIKINSITINTVGRLAVVSGHADTRDQALAFQDSLKNNPFVEDVSAPLENFLQEQSVDFSFTLSLK